MPIEEKLDEKQGNSLNRREFLRLLFAGGVAAALEACGIRPEEKKEIPQIALEELISHPDIYEKVPLFKTSGYPEEIGESAVSVPIIKMVKIGNFQTYQIDWISTKTETYKLHTALDKETPSMEFIIKSGTYIPWVPVQPESRNLVMEDEYELVGKLGKVRVTEGDKQVEKYMLQPNEVNKVELPTPQSNK